MTSSTADAQPEVPRPLHQLAELLDSHHAISSSTGIGIITRDNPRRAWIRRWHLLTRPCGRCLHGRRPLQDRDLPPHRRRRRVLDFRRGGRPLEQPRLRALGGHLHPRRRERAALPREKQSGDASVNNSTSGARRTCAAGGNGKSGSGNRLPGYGSSTSSPRWQAMNWDAGQAPKAQMDIADLPADLDYTLPGASKRGTGFDPRRHRRRPGRMGVPPPTSSPAGVKGVSGSRGSPRPTTEAQAMAARASPPGLLREGSSTSRSCCAPYSSGNNWRGRQGMGS